jgi:hypothetical protein
LRRAPRRRAMVAANETTMSTTTRLDYDDPGLLEFRARVVASTDEGSGRSSVILDRTAFYPESGGQMSDRGELGATVSTQPRHTTRTIVRSGRCSTTLRPTRPNGKTDASGSSRCRPTCLSTERPRRRAPEGPAFGAPVRLGGWGWR